MARDPRDTPLDRAAALSGTTNAMPNAATAISASIDLPIRLAPGILRITNSSTQGAGASA
jgi:hypothetical protein